MWNKVKSWIGHAVGAIMGVVAFASTGFTNPLAGFQVYSFVSGAINSAISGDIGAFAIGTAASSVLGGFCRGIGQAFDPALGNFSETFMGGFIIGAAEFGAAGFASGFVSEYARTGSGSSALRGAAWGAAISGGIGGLIEGSYKAGWQDTMHGTPRKVKKAAISGQTQTAVDIGQSEGGVEGRAKAEADIAKSNTKTEVSVDLNSNQPAEGIGIAKTMYSAAGLTKHAGALQIAANVLDTSGPFEFTGKLIGSAIGAVAGAAAGSLYGPPGIFWGTVLGGYAGSKTVGTFMRRFDSPYAGKLY